MEVIALKTSVCVSLVLALAVMAVYASLPALRNLHGTLLICYLATYIAVLCGCISWTCPGTESFNRFIIYLQPFLDTWPTVISFDIWLTFRRPGRQPHGPHGRRLLVYWLAAVVHPLSVDLVDIIFCCLSDASKSYGLLSFHVLLNISLFLFTLYNIRSARYRHHGAVTSQGLLLSARLALLVGLEWATILVSILVHSKSTLTVGAWVFTVKGVLLFVLLVCNARVLRLIRVQVVAIPTCRSSRPGVKHTNDL